MYVRASGLMHRDIKPANLFITRGGGGKGMEDAVVVKLGDFGLSTAHTAAWEVMDAVNDDGVEGVKAGQSSMMDRSHRGAGGGRARGEGRGDERDKGRLQHTVGAGTHTYMAPEQMGGKFYSEKCDVYSVGVVLLQMVANFKSVMQRVDALDAAARMSEDCDDPQVNPKP